MAPLGALGSGGGTSHGRGWVERARRGGEACVPCCDADGLRVTAYAMPCYFMCGIVRASASTLLSILRALGCRPALGAGVELVDGHDVVTDRLALLRGHCEERFPLVGTH